MSPLAFDKQGKPLSWHPRTGKLCVRRFRNPAARGTCCQVLDAVGSPLFVASDIEYAELRRIGGNVPGLYRFDQCDEDAEVAANTGITDLATRFANTDDLTTWSRTLPQCDDEGIVRDDPKVTACRPPSAFTPAPRTARREAS